MFSFLNPLPHLPHYPGPHHVGTAEFEIPISEIPSSTLVPDPQISTIKFRLFYPTNPDAKSKENVYWLPEPQKEWNDAYAAFMGADSGWGSALAAGALRMWNHARLPASKDAPLLPPSKATTYPVCIFSHGLGGNFNTYSSIVGSLASCGIVCVAPEHRDGSSPISFIKDAQGQVQSTIPYQVLSHTPSTEVLNARNKQLRVRLWELELTYSAVAAMNAGKTFTNYAAIANQKEKDQSGQIQNMLADKMDLNTGRVTWSGHSFGAATITQFVKSVFHHQYLPQTPVPDRDDTDAVDWTPLYKCSTISPLVQQITPQSPVVLLDLWTMALRGESTKWLWERPMPSYYRQIEDNTSSAPSTVAIISAEFYKWTDLLNRTRALLSASPEKTSAAFEKRKQDKEQAQTTTALKDETIPQNPIPQLSKQTSESAPPPPTSADLSRSPSPNISGPSTPQSDSASSSSTSLSHSLHDKTSEVSEASEPRLYLVPRSAHLSQSDFGVLFPNLTKYVMKAVEPEKTLLLNIRAILATMKGQGLAVESLEKGKDNDDILGSREGSEKIDRWIRVPLSDD